MEGHYRNLGIDLTMTAAPSDSKGSGLGTVGTGLGTGSKLYPEVQTPKLTLDEELGLQLSETKMNASFSTTPQKERVEHVKRQIIPDEPADTHTSQLTHFATFILDLIKKVSWILILMENFSIFTHC